MEAFQVAYDDETKQWVKKPLTTPRDLTPHRNRLPVYVMAVVVSLQVMVGTWVLRGFLTRLLESACS